MANLSTAEGELTAKGPTKSILAFLELTTCLENGDYFIKINDYNDRMTEIKDLDSIDDDEEIFEFIGFGRWNFEHTLQSLFSWIDDERQKDNIWTDTYEKAWQQLCEHPLTIEMEYIDYDGAEFLIRETATLTWHKKQIDKATVQTHVQNEYEMTASNYDKYTGERYYDYSSYSVNKLKLNPDVDWIKEINDTPLEDTIDVNLFRTHFDELTARLGLVLDQISDEEVTSLWVEPTEWFSDETVQEAIETAIKEIKIK